MKTHKFKVGDVVGIKTRDNISRRHGIIFRSEMELYCDTKATICDIRKNLTLDATIYTLDNSDWSWHEDWLELIIPVYKKHLSDDLFTLE